MECETIQFYESKEMAIQLIGNRNYNYFIDRKNEKVLKNLKGREKGEKYIFYRWQKISFKRKNNEKIMKE